MFNKGSRMKKGFLFFLNFQKKEDYWNPVMYGCVPGMNANQRLCLLSSPLTSRALNLVCERLVGNQVISVVCFSLVYHLFSLKNTASESYLVSHTAMVVLGWNRKMVSYVLILFWPTSLLLAVRQKLQHLYPLSFPHILSEILILLKTEREKRKMLV